MFLVLQMSQWEALIEWVRPELPALIQDWKLVGDSCIGQHMLRCEHRAKVGILLLSKNLFFRGGTVLKSEYPSEDSSQRFLESTELTGRQIS